MFVLSTALPPLDPEVIEKLSLGVLAHFLPELQKAKTTLGELTYVCDVQINCNSFATN